MVVPSRGRPQNIARLWDTMEKTCQGNTSLLVGLDTDDPLRTDYPEGPAYIVRSGLHQVVAWINELSVPRAGDYRFIGSIGDDNVPRTPGWDVALMEALRETPFAFADDLYPGRAPGTLCCHLFCRSAVITSLGYLGPPSIRHMYVDVAWMAWGTACGITFLPDVVIEHLHYTTGAPLDETYRLSSAATYPDFSAWHAYGRSGQLNADIRRLGGQPFSDTTLAQFNTELIIPERWAG